MILSRTAESTGSDRLALHPRRLALSAAHGSAVIWAVGLVTFVLLAILGARYRSILMLPDNFNYIGYWQQIVEHSFQTTALQTPKPLAILVFGALYRVTGGTDFLTILFVGVGVLLVASSAAIAQRLGGPLAAAATLVFLLANGSLPQAIIEGSSELLCAAVIVWLIARHLRADGITPPDAKTAVALLAIGLLRPENWVISGFVAVATFAYVWFRPAGRSSRAILGRQGWPALVLRERSTLGFAVLPLLAALVWIGFDTLAFGNPLFSFALTRHFAAVANAANSSAGSVALARYPLAVVLAIRHQLSPVALVWTAIGAVVVFRRRASALALLALPCLAIVLFYVAAYVSRMAIFDRFYLLLVVALLILAAVGWTEVLTWLLARGRRYLASRDRGGLEPAWSAIVVLALSLALVFPIHSLPGILRGLNLDRDSRLGAIAAASAVRADSSYSSQTPVVVYVGNQTLVAWELRSDDRNVIDPYSWLYNGGVFDSSVRTAYFIHDPRLDGNPGSIYPSLQANRFPGFSSTQIFDNSVVQVYKITRRG